MPTNDAGTNSVTRKAAARQASATEVTSSTRGAQPDRRRVQILQESATLFDEFGYSATSMNDIADAVGVRKPTLYHYFDTKDEILFWLHEEFINTLIARQEQRMADEVPADRMVFEIMADILALMETHKGHVRTFFENHRELPERHRKSSIEKRNRYGRMLEDAIAQGTKDGSFRDVEPDLTALAVMGMVNWAYQWYLVGGSRTPRDIAAVFADLVLNGLAAGPARS